MPAAWVAKLNEKVAAKQTKDPNLPETEVLKKPVSAVHAGFPVYVERQEYFTYMSWIVCLYVAANAFMANPKETAILTAAIFLCYDNYSGVLHMVLDHPPNIKLPFIGQACLEFQWHHHIGNDIAVKGFRQACADITIAVVIMGGWVFGVIAVVPSIVTTIPLLPAAMAIKILVAYWGQYSHMAAHTTVAARNPIASACQSLGLMVHPHKHHEHHTEPHNTRFCLIGVFDPVVQVLFDNFSPNAILVVFVVLSLSDVFFVAYGVERILSLFA